MKFEGNGLFPRPAEIEYHDMEIFHRVENQNVGQIH